MHEQLLCHVIASVHACMYVIEVRIKVEFSAALDGNFYQWRTQFYKSLTLRAPKSLAFRGCFFFHNLHKLTFSVWSLGWRSWDFKFELYFYRFRWNCSWLTFCADYKYEKDRTFGDRLDSDQFRAGNRTNQFVYFHALKTSHDTKSSHSLGNRRAFTRGKMQDATDWA